MSKVLPKYYSVSLGADPEFFLTKDGGIVGSENVIPEIIEVNGNQIVQDGVQVEIHPIPSTCRESLAYHIANCFQEMAQRLKDSNLGINFSQVVEVPLEEFDRLSDKSKQFGCVPSQNIYKSEDMAKITVDPSVDRKRSAGGHIHLGFIKEGDELHTIIQQKPERLIRMLDILVGNTCVMIDRNPWAKERRKVYGRAGEHRVHPHGIEYRTLSNFWLQHYTLMSFVFGMSRWALNIVLNGEEYEKSILDMVDMSKIERAINTNNFILARSNWRKIQGTLTELVAETENIYGRYPIDKYVLKEFHHFIKKDIGYWFKDDPLAHWTNLKTPNNGWYNFLITKVREDRTKKIHE